jgi:hypothetical protein
VLVKYVSSPVRLLFLLDQLFLMFFPASMYSLFCGGIVHASLFWFIHTPRICLQRSLLPHFSTSASSASSVIIWCRMTLTDAVQNSTRFFYITIIRISNPCDGSLWRIGICRVFLRFSNSAGNIGGTGAQSAMC